MKRRLAAALVAALILALGMITVLSLQRGQQASFDSAAAEAGEAAEGPRLEEWLRQDYKNGVSVEVLFLNPFLKGLEARGDLVFQVFLNTHSVPLEGYDLTGLALLRNDRGEEIRSGFRWEPQTESSHHRSGYLRVAEREAGEGFLAGSRWLELEIREIAGVPVRIFHWDLQTSGSGQA